MKLKLNYKVFKSRATKHGFSMLNRLQLLKQMDFFSFLLLVAFAPLLLVFQIEPCKCLDGLVFVLLIT